MWQVLNLPPLNEAASNLAGILPLSSLIEFVDVVTKLHMHELSGRGFAWNWPITTAGARVLVERAGSWDEEGGDGGDFESCVLDGTDRLPPLHCIDMKWGDDYVCASRFTVRKCIATAELKRTITTPSVQKFRPQKLEIVHIFLRPDNCANPPSDVESAISSDKSIESDVTTSPIARGRSIKWITTAVVGWAFWTAFIIFSALCGRAIALSYLAVLPATGMVVDFTFGHRPRQLVKKTVPKPTTRTVIVAENYNARNWTLFVGDNQLVDSLLNKSLVRTSDTNWLQIKSSTWQLLLRECLRVFIAAQWGLVVAASALQNWDALIISSWIIVCACTSTFVFTPRDSISSWLRANDVGLEKATVTFSGRRAMLTTMFLLNPDRKFSKQYDSKWLDPILKSSIDRSSWEVALVSGKVVPDKDGGLPVWADAIEEGKSVADQIMDWLPKLAQPIP